MDAWWKTASENTDGQSRLRAVAYYRHSAEIGQENSVEIQQDNVRAFAEKHSLDIIEEFADRGKSGLNAEGRPAFNEMMECVRRRHDFCLILVLDVSRWGRFQDTDLSAHYDSLCTQHGKQVIYTNIGFTRDEDRLINQLRKNIDRYQSAEYSRTLSKKVFEGAAKVAEQGYRPGGPPPYGFHRMMLDENKEPDRILQPGQRKAIQNGRVVLVPGDAGQVEAIQEIFVLFVEKGFDERQIAGCLNAKGMPSPGGVRWGTSSVRHILTNEQYAGAVVYNRTTQRLKTKRRTNPRDKWIITPDSYDPIVSHELFDGAQAILEGRKRRYTREEMLLNLHAIYDKYSIVTSRLIQVAPECPSPGTYASAQDRKCFTESLDAEFADGFADALTDALAKKYPPELVAMFRARRRRHDAKRPRFFPLLQFVVTDRTKRLFAVERVCFTGQSDWIRLETLPLSAAVMKYLPHLGRDSFFDLM